MEQKINIKVYRDNQLSRRETYLPIVKRETITFLSKVNHWIATSGEWPREITD